MKYHSFFQKGVLPIAVTRIIPMHISKGKTALQSLSARLDYATNPNKTRNGELVTAYACDPHTADAEFALSRRQYRTYTGRTQKHEVIAYQVRQSFKPGEVTPEEANAIGFEFANRFLKGNHAFMIRHKNTQEDKQIQEKSLLHKIVFWLE